MSIRCPICKEIFGDLTSSHIKKHGLTMEEFHRKYPEFKNACNTALKNTPKGLHGVFVQRNQK